MNRMITETVDSWRLYDTKDCNVYNFCFHPHHLQVSYVDLSCLLGKKFFRGSINPKGNTLSGMNPIISAVNKRGGKVQMVL